MNTISNCISQVACFFLMATSEVWAQGSPCPTNADTAAIHIIHVTDAVSRGDSARTVALGIAWPIEMATHAVVDTDSASLAADNLPLGVDTVTVVADEHVCAAIVATYNGLIPAVDSAQRISRAVAMQAGPIFVMALPPERRGHRDVLYFFTSSFHFISRHECTGLARGPVRDDPELPTTLAAAGTGFRSGVTAFPGSRSVEWGTCVTHPDSAEFVISLARSVLIDSDSTELARQGLPFEPDSISVVTEEPICSAIIAAHNAAIPPSDSAARLTRGVILRADSVYALSPPPDRPGHARVLFWFSRTFTFIAQSESH